MSNRNANGQAHPNGPAAELRPRPFDDTPSSVANASIPRSDIGCFSSGAQSGGVLVGGILAGVQACGSEASIQ